MPKCRMMGAGLAGSLAYKDNTNGNQGGGNKKQGLAPTTNKAVEFVLPAIQNRAYGENRNLVFCMNQLGGVGAAGIANNSRMFATTADGVKDCVPTHPKSSSSSSDPDVDDKSSILKDEVGVTDPIKPYTLTSGLVLKDNTTNGVGWSYFYFSGTDKNLNYASADDFSSPLSGAKISEVQSDTYAGVLLLTAPIGGATFNQKILKVENSKIKYIFYPLSPDFWPPIGLSQQLPDGTTVEDWAPDPTNSSTCPSNIILGKGSCVPINN